MTEGMNPCAGKTGCKGLGWIQKNRKFVCSDCWSLMDAHEKEMAAAKSKEVWG